MKYTIYKITNKINGKYYIGKHQTSNLDDGYMGSGKVLRRAINKHGVENFTKEILHVFDTEQEMNAKEKELVVVSEDTYNLCDGGHGGFGYINKLGINNKDHDEKTRLKTTNALKGRRNEKVSIWWKTEYELNKRKRQCFYDWNGKNHTEETKLKMSKANKGKVPWNKGVPRTEEDKEKIRQGVLKKLVP